MFPITLEQFQTMTSFFLHHHFEAGSLQCIACIFPDSKPDGFILRIRFSVKTAISELSGRVIAEDTGDTHPHLCPGKLIAGLPFGQGQRTKRYKLSKILLLTEMANTPGSADDDNLRFDVRLTI